MDERADGRTEAQFAIARSTDPILLSIAAFSEPSLGDPGCHIARVFMSAKFPEA